MTDPRLTELLNAEIDGVLDAPQRAELSRRLLSNPDARAAREDLRRVCAALDSIPELDPPPGLCEQVFAALPQEVSVTMPRHLGTLRGWSSVHLWRYAALFAGVVFAGAIVFHTVSGPGPANNEIAGTIATGALDSARVEGPVSGTVTLYREGGNLDLRVDVSASVPVRPVIVTDGRSLRQDVWPDEVAGATQRTIPLTGLAMHGQPLELIFLNSDRPVASARLQLPESP
jgi:anti-sigma factor RsiW